MSRYIRISNPSSPPFDARHVAISYEKLTNEYILAKHQQVLGHSSGSQMLKILVRAEIATTVTLLPQATNACANLIF
jgi:hypothetical protein